MPPYATSRRPNGERPWFLGTEGTTGRQDGVRGREVVSRRSGVHKKEPRSEDLGSFTAVLTGFEPAASTLTGWRALQTAPQDQVSRRHSCVALREETVQEGGALVELTLRAHAVT